jgi:hypothetical protein
MRISYTCSVAHPKIFFTDSGSRIRKYEVLYGPGSSCFAAFEMYFEEKKLIQF